jgi:hypothetical protein
MKPDNRVVIMGLCALLLISVMWAANTAAEDVDEGPALRATITGTVMVVDWDENYKPTAVAIDSMGEDYFVTNNAVGLELLKLENKVVEAVGIVHDDGKGMKEFTVTNYTVIPE